VSIEKSSQVEFSAALAFLPHVSDKMTFKPSLLTLSTGNSIKVTAWVHQGKTTQWLED
jgi:hypothetical protein